jgi:hypothetical protein
MGGGVKRSWVSASPSKETSYQIPGFCMSHKHETTQDLGPDNSREAYVRPQASKCKLILLTVPQPCPI